MWSPISTLDFWKTNFRLSSDALLSAQMKQLMERLCAYCVMNGRSVSVGVGDDPCNTFGPKIPDPCTRLLSVSRVR